MSMHRAVRSLPYSTGLALIFTSTLFAQQAPKPVKIHAGMLRYPCISAKQIVFVYANKLWVVPREGGTALPVATPLGRAALPKFNSDGSQIAFTGNYDGNQDLYTLPVEGGEPVRVTHHPAVEKLCNWTPDGKLLFASNGLAGIQRQDQLYSVSPTGGLPVKLPVPYGDDAAISPDGKTLAYTPSSTNNRTWKRYRGGWAQDIWLFNLEKKTSRKITDWEGTDTLPMWQGANVYYLSDGGAEHRLNIWRYDTKTSQRKQITKLAEYDIKWPSIGPGTAGGGEIIFQYGAELSVLDLSTNKIRTVEVRIPGDKNNLRPKMTDTTRFISDASLSPSGKNVAIEARGDIWSAPVKDGTPRNLTHSSGVAERFPAWSPDGRWISYFSDETGEYELCLIQSDGKGEEKQLTKNGGSFRLAPTWSPDSKYITFSDKSGAFFLVAVATGQIKLLDTEPTSGAIAPSWSPDSRWLVYARRSASRNPNSALYAYNLETAKTKQLTSGMFDDDSPVFDHKGDYLYFSSSRRFQPLYDDNGSSWIYSGTKTLIAAPLRNDVASPYLAKPNVEPFNEEKTTEEKKTNTIFAFRDTLSAGIADDPISGDWKGEALGKAFTLHLKLESNNAISGSIEVTGSDGTVSGTFTPATKQVIMTLVIKDGPTINMEGKVEGSTLTGTGNVGGVVVVIMAERIGGAGGGATSKQGESATAKNDVKKTPIKVSIDLDGFERRAYQLSPRPGQFGKLAVNDRNQLIFVRTSVPGSEEGAGIKLFDINDEKKQELTVSAGTFGFDISPDGKKLLLRQGGNSSVQDASAGATADSVVTSGMNVLIDPRAEWKQLFNEAWRLQRDYFYDPNMHGVNWKSVREQYSRMIEDCANRDDVSYVVSEMISELNVGHAYYGGGDIAPEPSVSVGMLGVDFELNEGAYRIAKIHSGAEWDVDARSPLQEAGMKVKEGDYLLAVNGSPLDATQDPWTAFVGMANRTVAITVSDKPKMDKSVREVSVRLLGDEANLRYRGWIEKNRAYVSSKTGGRVGYIYVPDTGTGGQNDLVRQFMGQIDKEALVIDDRWNGGGQIPDRFIELLNRPISNYWAKRDGVDWSWPPISHQGPKCMLINGLAGSGGDAFPWYFRQSKLGKLIGTRTWGGLVGLSGNPGLIDGATVTVPTFAFYKPNGTWGIEGHGVDPDIEAIDDPALMTNGGDPQLDAAIKEMLEALKRSPYAPPKRPAYPNKSGMGIPDKDK